jgi:hypothetical protein
VSFFSMRRLWYFGFLLMMGVLICCGVSCFIHRCMYPPPLIQEPVYNLSYTIQPPNPAAGTQQSVPPYYTYPEGLGNESCWEHHGNGFPSPTQYTPGRHDLSTPSLLLQHALPSYEQVGKHKQRPCQGRQRGWPGLSRPSSSPGTAASWDSPRANSSLIPSKQAQLPFKFPVEDNI